MASFIFEEGTQTQASGFKSGDTLIFKTATPTTLDVTYNQNGGFSVPTITLAFGSTTLEFAADALSGGVKQFLGGGALVIGANTGAETLTNAALTSSDTIASAFYGLGGTDSIVVNSAAAHIIDMGAGLDSINAAGAGAYVLQGGADADTINAAASTGNLHIYGNVVGAAGLADGADTIILGSGNSYINGNAGADSIYFGGSVSTFGVNRVAGGKDNDYIDLSGNTDATKNQTVNGNAGNDTILGGAGNDILRGGQDEDSIVGGAGNDQLFGDAGNDTLVGGAGIDVLTGGAGNDVFIFAGNDANAGTGALAGFFDEIRDFTTGSDKIGLTQVTTTVAANVIVPTGATFTTEAAARVQAQQLLDNTTVAANTHNVVVVQVGTDSYLYSGESANTQGTTIDTIVKLDGVTAANVKASDFI